MNTIKHVVLPNGITSLGDFAFINESGILTSINLPEGIRRIGKYAIAGNSLTSISIPSSVEKIDTAAFSLSYELQAYHVAAGNQHYTVENGVLFNKDKSTLIAYPLKKQDTQYSVPSSVNTIDYGAFWWCETLTKIILPEGLTRISSEAFGSCTNLALRQSYRDTHCLTIPIPRRYNRISYRHRTHLPNFYRIRAQYML